MFLLVPHVGIVFDVGSFWQSGENGDREELDDDLMEMFVY